MTDLPKGYDDWRLAGPDEPPELPLCGKCEGTGEVPDEEGWLMKCEVCNGEGIVQPEEPDEDYLYEQARDQKAGI